MITMKGKMVTLEPLDVQKHAKGYFEVCQDERIHKYTGNTVPQCIDETIVLLKKYEKYFYNWMIISNESMTVIGIIRLSKPETESGLLTAGESQFLMSQYWRKGHMKEVKRLFYQHIFRELSVDTLYADVWEGNTNSIKSLESYGYKFIDVKSEIFSKTGKYALKFIYALHKDDYLRKSKEYQD